ncbi:GNAT family N-acetyltransferase [uncultured Kordia sp.]|uniref:GNAT family N-acetyltransferase n=1 Tax=uncultured Kordia sp. TaxID=507699 RepID=UPI00260C6B5C|nr:GNAT family N-acetyltransferase [uncultured Kordia sp.]
MSTQPKAIEIRDFKELKDDAHILSFLEGRKNAHKLSALESKEWFLWKFCNSPYGTSLMSCAYDEEKRKIAGSNFYGILKRKHKDQELLSVLPYEAFVDPEYQGMGVFKKMILFGEEYAKKEGVQVMLAFPNTSSLKGFIRRGWTQVENPVAYLTKIQLKVSTLVNMLDIKKAFVHNPSTRKNTFEFTDLSESIFTDQIYGIWTKVYLEWRFNENPAGEYAHTTHNDCSALARIGRRGKLKEAQILFVDKKGGEISKKEIKVLIKNIKKQTNANIISFPMSSFHPLYGYVTSLGFINLKSKTNFTYKIIDEKLEGTTPKFALSGLDFHTY